MNYDEYKLWIPLNSIDLVEPESKDRVQPADY